MPQDTATESLPPNAPVEDRVRALLADHFSADLSRVTDDALLVEDLGADSLDLIEIALEIEERFPILVPDEDLEGARTVGNVVQFVRHLVDAAAAKAA